jgi:hypothetical protein
LPGNTPRYAAEQHAAAAKVFRQKISAHQHGHAARDFAHGFEQGQAAVDLDSFVGERGNARLHQRLHDGLVGGEMQVGK